MENAKGLSKRIDRRTLKTKKAIKDALASLMAEKSIGNITITDIAALADINRKTFYTYYKNAYDILDEIENELIQAFNNIWDATEFSKSKYNPVLIFENLNTLLCENLDFYKQLFALDSYNSFSNKIKSVIKARVSETLVGHDHANQDMIPYIVEYIAAGTTYVYQEWFNSDRSESLEDVSKTAGALAFNGLNALFNPPSETSLSSG